MSDEHISSQDQRLIEALQVNGRVTADRVGEVLDLDPRLVQRRWRSLLGDGTVRVVLQPPSELLGPAIQLRIKVLRGRVDTIAEALTRRPDISFIDIASAGDEIGAILLGRRDAERRLLFEQLPSTSAVTSVSAQTILHLFSEASDWRIGALTEAERSALGSPTVSGSAGVPDELDAAILRALSPDARATAASISATVDVPVSTVRRRLAALLASGAARTVVVVDPARLGLAVDANLRVTLPPDRLDAAGRALARHPGVHGAFATTGHSNLSLAVWFTDLEALYRFVTEDLARVGATAVDSWIAGRTVKRPGTVGTAA